MKHNNDLINEQGTIRIYDLNIVVQCIHRKVAELESSLKLESG